VVALPCPALPFPSCTMLLMNRFLSRRSVCAILLTMVSLNLSADDSVDFNRDIRPLMSSNCLTCHGPDEAERAADLRLDTEQGSRQDLGGYAAVVPGDPDASELVVRLTTDDEDLLMPPEGKGRRLSEEEVDLIRRWIRQGAAYARHWAYQRPTRRPLPSVGNQDWPRNPIDHFILSRLESEGLQPSAEADRLTLARRAALDLTGLPPTWQQAMAFVHDERENAYELYVDQLLAQEAFGERWARVWLDLARYADSAGYADDPPRTIWAYRDYVIRSLNDNKPFDQFTIEQIAGDLMPEPSDEQLLATAFHRNTLTNNEGGTNDEEFRNVAIIDRVNTTMAVWMGTTMACAQCHTHKYDPITQEEYFRFFALFNNSQDSDQRDERPLLSLWSQQQEQQKASWSERVSELNSLLRQSTPELERAQHAWLENARSQPQWLTLTPDSAVSKQQRELVVGEDAWVHGRGDGADRDAYTLTIPTTDFELVGLRLEVGAEQTDNFVLTGVTANWTPAATESLPARYVRVELPGKNRILHVAEIEAFRGDENVAAAGTATQSSTDFGGEARFANDSTTDGNFREHTTTHTATEDDPWLEIDLTQLSVIDRVVVWNRSDGGSSISDRLKGFKLVLLDERREVIWEHSPDEVPAQRGDYSARGAVPLKFDAAIVDYHQQGFPAESLIAGKPDNATGWAIGGATGKPHDLTLLMREPRTLGVGTLTIQLDQASVHAGHLLDQFRISSTADSDAAQWAAMPVAIRELVRAGNENLDQGQLAQLAEYYRGIALELEPLREEKSQLEKKLREIKPHTTVPVMRELPEDKRRVTKVQVRGNYLSTTDEVTAGTPVAFHPLPDDRPRDRMALARWLVDKENPLTPRVIANRHWEQIFGIGMVETSEEFGSQGELPSHPELLDWLAAELRDSGWDLKALLKLMVTSATYRQSSITTESLIEADPQNRLLARGPRFRISAEMVRDQALYVSGLLSNKMYGKPVNPPQPELGLKAAFGSATDWKTSGGEDKYRRGVYTTWRRSSPYPSMAQFDAPNREVCTVRRIRTNTPLQALVTLNDPVYVEAAQSLARRMMAAGPSPRQRVQFGVRHCLIRDPKPQETERLVRLAEEATKQFAADPDQAMKMATVPIGPLPQGSDAAETAAWTVVGNVILNLDEMYMKR
jgi:hypothetical protein